MELVWQTNAWEDYLYWQEQDKKKDSTTHQRAY
jgi:Txe/YoeB family toxin of Txe-Axe toxin-antitoxin module